MEEPMNIERIPQTDSIQELAHFWDTHDVTDFEDELEEVFERAFERRTHITVPLDTADAKVLCQMAKSRGLHEADLVREWVLEKIRH